MNLFKRQIPSGETKEITELESWTISWTSYIRDFSEYGTRKKYSKVFIHEEEANEFVEQLKISAAFLKTDITFEKYKN